MRSLSFYGQWPAIYGALVVDLKATHLKHQPCPACGGKDRFRLFSDWAETGGAICNQCGAGNGVTWIGRIMDKCAPDAINLIRQTLDSPSQPNYQLIIEQTQRRERFRRAIEAEERASAIRQNQAAERAEHYWYSSCSISHFDYLSQKGIKKFNARVWANLFLLVPLTDVSGNLWNIQFIDEQGAKRFLPGGRVKGCFSLLGEPPAEGRVYICEGWATASSIHSATGCAVFAAMNAGNLKPVALEIAKYFPNLEVIIAGDDDRATSGNPGRKKAEEAARAIGSIAVFPNLCEGCNCTDFNDQAMCTLNRGAGL